MSLVGAAIYYYWPVYVAISCSCVASFLLVTGGGLAAGQTPNTAVFIGLTAVLCCCLSSSAWAAFSKWRCPNGCRNVLAGPDPE